MTSDPEDPRYELRGGRLFVNGERQPVAAETVIAASALYRAEAKEPVDPDPLETEAIPEELGRLILSLEARKAVRELSLALGPVLAA